jgi:hypothetical protein
MNTCGMQRAPLPVRKPKQTGVALRHAATRNEIIAETVSGNVLSFIFAKFFSRDFFFGFLSPKYFLITQLENSADSFWIRQMPTIKMVVANHQNTAD